MNKLALAIALVAASSSLNAATIYKKDGFTFKVDGDIQIQLRQRVGNNEDVHVDFDDSELKNKISYDLGNGLVGFAETHFDSGKDVNGAVEAEETFVGLKNDTIKVQLGRMDYVTDGFATEKGIEEPLNQTAFEADTVSGSDVLLLEAGNDAFTFAFSHDFGDSTRNTALSSTDILLSAKLASNFSVAAAAQNLKETATSATTRTTGINAKLKVGKIAIAADHSSRDDNNTDTDLHGLKVTNVSVGFPLAKTTKATVGFTNQSNDNNNVDDGWYANVVYKFPKAKKVSLFAEIQDTNGNNSDMGFLAGMRVKF